MKIKDITDYIESLVPLELQEDYDNSGLILGSPEMEIRAVLLCLDITKEVLEEAAMKGCNLIISHHPLIFKGIRRITGSDDEQKIIIQAIRNDIAVYALHTNLDNAIGGLNSLLCSKLGIKKVKVLQPSANMLKKLVTFCPVEFAEKVRQALFDAGAGHIGNYDCCSFNLTGQGTFRASDAAQPFVGEKNLLHFENETRIEVIFPSYIQQPLVKSLIANHPYEEVAFDIYPLHNTFDKAGAGITGELEEEKDVTEVFSLIKEVTGIPVIRHSAPAGKKIKRISLCTGSGSFLIPDAIRANSDLFLTADLKYHDFFKTSGKMILADIGHYESEHFVKEWIYSVLIEKFPNFAILISGVNTNPINYF
jgi:dinuclear metal center YbgI/SA1388 family protein